MQIVWVFILTLGIADETVIDMEFEASNEADCWNGRAAIMEQVQAKGDDYRYWYITGCEPTSRDT